MVATFNEGVEDEILHVTKVLNEDQLRISFQLAIGDLGVINQG